MSHPSVRLAEAFARRMLWLATAAGVAIGLSAPTAYYLVRREEEVEEAKTIATQIARIIKDVAETRGPLWRYDYVLLDRGLEGFEEEDELARVFLLDTHGHVLPARFRSADRRVPFDAIWGTASVRADNRKVAVVAVAMDPFELVRNSLLLLGAFGLVGWGLATLIYRLATREVSRQEAQVAALVHGLEVARGGLEAELAAATHRIVDLADRTTRLLEEDRAGIARDLHDGVGQSLYALKLRLELLAEDLPSPDLRSAAERTASLVETAIEEVRRATRAMVPPALEKLGLAGAVRAACDLLASSGDVDVSLEIETLPDDLPPDVASTCYRVIQEGLTNAVKHGRAQRVEVHLGIVDGVLRIDVRDDGRGFDPASVRRGVGLDGMQARIERLGGAVVVRSKEGQGTSLEARVPMIGS